MAKKAHRLKNMNFSYQRKAKIRNAVKRYDLLHPSRCLIEENPRYLRMEHENHESYVAYLTINTIVGRWSFLLQNFLLPATTIHFSH